MGYLRGFYIYIYIYIYSRQLKGACFYRSYPSPVRGLFAVENNKVLCVGYRDLKYGDEFLFPSTRLPGAIDPPNVLRPEDLRTNNPNEYQLGGRGGRGGFRGGYNPRMGFGGDRRDQASLGDAGHRMLSHHVPRGGGRGGNYGAVPPPLMGMPMRAQEVIIPHYK